MSKFGPFSIKQSAQELFGTLEITEEQEYGRERAIIGEFEGIITIDLDENEADSHGQLVDAAYYCWQRIKTTEEDNHACAIVSRTSGSNNKEDILSSLRIRDFDATDSLESNWNIPNTITPYIRQFYICTQDAWNDVLSFTYDLSDCGMSGRFNEQRTITLNADTDIATEELAGSLARCWTIAAARGEDLVCDTINPSRLSNPISKQTVIDSIGQYEDAYAADRLDDWWEPDNDAEFPHNITRSTNPFYSCSSERATLSASRSDLCLTHNRANDCCT